MVIELLTVMQIIDKKSERVERIIDKTVTTLRKGGLVIFPSDTVYGALVDAENLKAVEKLLEFKKRPPGKAISVFVADMNMLERYVKVDHRQKNMLNQLLPGPFTVVLESRHRGCRKLESEYGTLGVRIPQYPLIQSLTTAFGCAITATSANVSGYSAHYSIHSLLSRLPKKKSSLIDLVVDAGVLDRNKPSTVIDLTGDTIKTLRKGDVSLNSHERFESDSPLETIKIAKRIIGRLIKLDNNKPLILVVRGNLGAGKTVFVKGVGEYFGLGNIISPTYVVSYEYLITHPCYRRIAHFDLYNIEKEEELQYIGLDQYTNSSDIVCIEWGEKLGERFKKLQSIGKVVVVDISSMREGCREIEVLE